MSRVLHLVKDGELGLLEPTLQRQAAAGDHVTVVLIGGAECAIPADGIDVRRLPGDLDYDRLLDLVFEADQVVAW